MWQPAIPFSNVFIAALIAAVPIIWVLFGMLKLQLPSYKTGIIALAAVALSALLIWKMPAALLLQSVAEGVLLGLFPIIWVIFAAIFTYNLLVKSGAMDSIKRMLSSISADPRAQVIIIAFAFGGFMEATAGFGTAVAIPVTILISMGFEAELAAVLCLVANTVPVAFGVVGIPVITLAQVTGLPLGDISLYTALQLLPLSVVLPFILVVITTGKVRDARGMLPAIVICGITFAAGQTSVAWAVGPELAAVVGSIFALAASVLCVRLQRKGKAWKFPGRIAAAAEKGPKIGLAEGLKAWSPYIFILVFVLASRLIPALSFLNRAPFTVKHLFYTGKGGSPMSFQLLSNPGTIILISAILGGLIQKVGIKDILSVAVATLKQITRTTVTVLTIIPLSKVMGYSGMISVISTGLTNVTGAFFPLVSPFIGALGTFVTGSDTSANALFGELQRQTAQQIGSSPSWLAAANAAGATIGKMVSPQSLAIAVSAIGIPELEGKIMKRTLKYAVVFVVVLGVIVYAGNMG
ncbi:MAG TPA: L-lactate permease [Clostridia bacterium]|nr:L-lactate permease [Clostridia bacterium]